MKAPDDLKYTKTHEWVRMEGTFATIGITDYAQEQLGDIVYVELPEEGDEVTQGERFGTIESVKAVSDLYSPLSGRVVEINEELSEHPELINNEPYGKGWMIRIEVAEPSEERTLLSVEEYKRWVEEEKAK